MVQRSQGNTQLDDWLARFATECMARIPQVFAERATEVPGCNLQSMEVSLEISAVENRKDLLKPRDCAAVAGDFTRW